MSNNVDRVKEILTGPSQYIPFLLTGPDLLCLIKQTVQYPINLVCPVNYITFAKCRLFCRSVSN